MKVSQILACIYQIYVSLKYLFMKMKDIDFQDHASWRYRVK